MMDQPLGDRLARWPHEIPGEPSPDGRLPPLRAMESLADRRARLAEAALARARRAHAVALSALDAARQALEEQVRFVEEERVRLREERQASPEAGGALRRWREADQRLLDSIPAYRSAVADCERELETAEMAWTKAQDAHRQRVRRHEKFELLIEQIVEAQ